MAAASSYTTLAARPMCSPVIGAPRLRKKSRPLRPISSSCTGAPAMLRDEALRAFDQVGVERAGQALVAGDQHQQDALLRRAAPAADSRRALIVRATAAATLASTLRSMAP